jgi:hypothetical protein
MLNMVLAVWSEEREEERNEEQVDRPETTLPRRLTQLGLDSVNSAVQS